jgi:hypothetical protein
MLMEYFANASNLYVEALAARRGMLSQSPPAWPAYHIRRDSRE